MDAAQFYTATGFSWEAMLYTKKTKLDLFTDLDMYNFVKKGIRGGLTTVGELRYADSNKKYLPNFEKEKESSFILYNDCNNLYGGAMMKPLPQKDFVWE
jgi:hypothetical protein